MPRICNWGREITSTLWANLTQGSFRFISVITRGSINFYVAKNIVQDTLASSAKDETEINTGARKTKPNHEILEANTSLFNVNIYMYIYKYVVDERPWGAKCTSRLRSTLVTFLQLLSDQTTAARLVRDAFGPYQHFPGGPPLGAADEPPLGAADEPPPGAPDEPLSTATPPSAVNSKE